MNRICQYHSCCRFDGSGQGRWRLVGIIPSRKYYSTKCSVIASEIKIATITRSQIHTATLHCHADHAVESAQSISAVSLPNSVEVVVLPSPFFTVGQLNDLIFRPHHTTIERYSLRPHFFTLSFTMALGLKLRGFALRVASEYEQNLIAAGLWAGTDTSPKFSEWRHRLSRAIGCPQR
jgi:hypothetical protein